MVAVTIINSLWDVAMGTVDRRSHTLVLHQEKQGFVDHGQGCSKDPRLPWWSPAFGWSLGLQ